MKDNMFEILQQINQKPKPYEYYTTPELWCDPYVSKQMLALHINKDEELASRKKEFIDRSADWIANHFKIRDKFKICDFGCGPGLYVEKFAQCGAQVTGIDFSETSINYAKEKASQNNLNIDYILQDYLKFTTDKKFDLITMIYCDFCALNPKQRNMLLKKFHDFLDDDGSVLLDVSSLVRYDSASEKSVYEYSRKNGFWSANPYYVFQNTFKYNDEHLMLEKFTIIEEARVRESYNWFQCYSVQSIIDEFKQNGFDVVEHYSNVAGDLYKDDSKEIAIVVKKL